MMRLDARGFILTVWFTLLSGTLSSTLTLNYFINTRGGTGFPTTLSETWGLLVGLWLGGVVGVSLMLLADWAKLSHALWTAMVGYWVAAFIRLILLGKFLPGADSQFNIFWQALTLQALPAHDAWWLWALLGGSVVILMVGVLVSLLPKLPEEMRQHTTLPEGRPILVTVVALGTVLMLLLIGLRSLDQDLWPTFSLQDTRWLLLPQTNMILAALLGFIVGGTYLCQHRYQASYTLFIALSLHVCLMLILDAMLSPYDPLNVEFNPNRIDFLPFVFLWWGVPSVGAIAAFALHNLRDAFQLPEEALADA